MYEVEQKFYVDHLDEVRRLLRELGAHAGAPVSQSDCYFIHPARDFSKTDEAFRLRSDGESTFLTYKGPRLDPVTKTRRELELALPEGEAYRDQFIELLRLLGFSVVAIVRKRRESAEILWDGQTVEVALDDVEGLGTFVELETQIGDAAGLDAARKTIAAVSARLGLVRNERRSYCELVLRG